MNENDKKFLVEKIRTQYMEKEESQVEELKALDAKVKRPVNIFSYSFGSVAALIMGSGMSLVMTDIGEKIGMSEPMISGVIIGVIGMVMAIANYPVYKKFLNARRKKYADEIIELSEKIIENN